MQNKKCSTLSIDVNLPQRRAERTTIEQEDSELKRLLVGINLQMYHPSFLSEDVTFCDLQGISEEELEDVIPKKVHRRRLLKRLANPDAKETSKVEAEKVGKMDSKGGKIPTVHMHVKWNKVTKKVYDIPLCSSNEEVVGKLLSEFLECEVKLQEEERVLAKSLKSFNLQEYAEEKEVSPGSMIRAAPNVKETGVEYFGCGGTQAEVEKLRMELENSQKTMMQKIRDFETVVKEKRERERRMLREACDMFYGLNGAKIDERKAFWIYEQLEKEGGTLDGNALFIFGVMYKRGSCGGVPNDKKKGSEYHKKAAEYYLQKDEADLKPIDLGNLGKMYICGIGLEKDFVKGVGLILRAVEKGDPVAMFYLAMQLPGLEFKYKFDPRPNPLNLMSKAVYNEDKTVRMAKSVIKRLADIHKHGWCGVEKDEVRAYGMYLQGAELGCKYAMAHLGFSLYYGEGVEVDKDTAKKWFRKASELGYELLVDIPELQGYFE